MSAQMALMGASAAMSVAGSVMGGNERAAAAGAQGRALDFQSMVQQRQGEIMQWQGDFAAKSNDFNAEITENNGYLNSVMRKSALGRFDVEAAGYDLNSEEVGLKTAQEERQRRAAISSLLSFNAADLSSRGVEGGIGSSADVLEKHNVAESEYDIKNVKRIGESQRRFLSFAAEDARTNKVIGGKMSDLEDANTRIDAANIRFQSEGIRLNAKLGASMQNLGATATKQAATQAWSQVGPATTAGWLQGLMSVGQMAMKFGGSFSGGGGGGDVGAGSGTVW